MKTQGRKWRAYIHIRLGKLRRWRSGTKHCAAWPVIGMYYRKRMKA